MAKLRLAFSIASVLAALILGQPAYSQSAAEKQQKFPLLSFDEAQGTCRAAGRLQDLHYCHSKLMDQIVAQGTAAIPILISQITETGETKEPIYDYWHHTSAGDIAFLILDDLFTESDETTFNLPRSISPLKDCHDELGAESCWRKYLKKHGRKFVQDQWLIAWNANKDRIYWNGKTRCFRLTPSLSKQ